jgi:oligoribonuclease (3'-5' exoribonuclease)
MKYLSFDLEATGLEEDAYIIEFGMIPFCTESRTLEHELSMQFYVQCPSFEELKPNLSSWVIENNEQLIKTAHKEGQTLEQFKQTMSDYVNDPKVRSYFGNQKIVLFGKSISAIDLPFLNRDLGWEWMNSHFHHRNLDLSCYTMGMIDMGLLDQGMDSGAKLMNLLGMGDVCHTALEDAINTAKMYLKLLNMFEHLKTDN